jgi:hypothetical protein
MNAHQTGWIVFFTTTENNAAFSQSLWLCSEAGSS